ncbi:hypothetical protein [Nocardia sp. NPDC049526]|uniref:DUF7373 family lipoprotein n=1 Tax=Nocardia sp. NPDC049526 TaxID=3364316 RepID=UPI0037B7EB4C
MKLTTRPTAVRIVVALCTVATLATASAGCGSQVTGQPVRVEPDASKLDFGNYQTKPRQVGNAKSDKQARAREAQRLADYVALPYEADPAYVEDAWGIATHIVLNRKTLGSLVINDTFDDVAKDLVAGWVNAWRTGGAQQDKRRTLNVAVLMFPDAQTASAVGPTLEHDDFTYNADNQPVSISKPNTYAHWRPDISSVGSWTVHDRYIVYIKVVDDTSAPDLPALTSQVEKMLGVQLPLLDKFQPTPAGELSRIPLDPQGLLGRTIPSNPERPIRAEPDGVFSGRGTVSLMNAGQATLPELEKYGVDLVSFGDAVVFRTKSLKDAEDLWTTWQPLKPDQKMVAAPAGLGEHVQCFADGVTEKNPTGSMNLCMFQVDRYVVQAFGKQLQDLHQKVSAQYVLLQSR